jgi:hypothetical protein
MNPGRCLSFSLAALFLGGICGAGDNPIATTTPLVALTIAAEDGPHLPLLPVVVQVRFENLSSSSQTVRGALGYDRLLDRRSPSYVFEVQNPDGSVRKVYGTDWLFRRITDGSAPDLTGPPIDPGEHQRLDFCLGVGFEGSHDRRKDKRTGEELVFPVAGNYAVRLSMEHPTLGNLTSNDVSIVVSTPITESDREALAVLSRSHWQRMLLQPFAYYTYGPQVSVLPWHPIRQEDTSTSPPFEVCERLLTEFPDSLYAHHARPILGTMLARGWYEFYWGRGKPQAVDIEKPSRGVDLLRQAAEDRVLPLRFRDAALVNLKDLSESLDIRIAGEGRDKAPIVESIFGDIPPALQKFPGGPQEALWMVYLAEHGSQHPAAAMACKALTGDEYDRIAKSVRSDPHVAAWARDTELQKRLHAHAKWASARLREIPWRSLYSADLDFGAHRVNPPEESDLPAMPTASRGQR